MGQTTPPTRCGYKTEYEGSNGREYGNLCCWRPTWQNTGKCIWHAKQSGKSVNELANMRSDYWERLDGANLGHTTINGEINFCNCTLIRTSFCRANLSDTDFSGSVIKESDFSSSELANAQFTGATIRKSDFSKSNFKNTQLSEAQLLSTNFSGADMEDANLTNVNTIFDGPPTRVNERKYYFYISNPYYAKPTHHAGKFKNANLKNADLSNSDLDGCDFRKATFESAELEGASLNRALLSNADLNHANLTNASLGEADLRKVNLIHAKLHDVDLRGSDLSQANLRGAGLTGAFLARASLPEANLRGARLSEARIRWAELTGIDVSEADLTDTQFFHSNLKKATFEDATLVRTDLRSADLRHARLYQVFFSDLRINHKTDFGTTSPYEQNNDIDVSDISPHEAAAWTYRRLEQLFEENAMSELARQFHIRKQEARRLQHKNQGNYYQWILFELSRLLTGHNDSPGRVIKSSIFVIGFSALLYPLIGGIRASPASEQSRTIAFQVLPTIPITFPTPLAEYALSLYFSVATFTTLGYGDLQPASGAAQALATLESVLGALLMALLVFVLGRRTTR